MKKIVIVLLIVLCFVAVVYGENKDKDYDRDDRGCVCEVQCTVQVAIFVGGWGGYADGEIIEIAGTSAALPVSFVLVSKTQPVFPPGIFYNYGGAMQVYFTDVYYNGYPAYYQGG